MAHEEEGKKQEVAGGGEKEIPMCQRVVRSEVKISPKPKRSFP